MHEFTKQEFTQALAYKKMAEFYLEVDPNCTRYDPLEIMPVGKPDPKAWIKHPEVPLRAGFKEIVVEDKYANTWYPKYQVRQVYDWVFSVGALRDLEKRHFITLLEFPTYNIWRDGYIQPHLLFDDKYQQILPKSDANMTS